MSSCFLPARVQAEVHGFDLRVAPKPSLIDVKLVDGVVRHFESDSISNSTEILSFFGIANKYPAHYILLYRKAGVLVFKHEGAKVTIVDWACNKPEAEQKVFHYLFLAIKSDFKQVERIYTAKASEHFQTHRNHSSGVVWTARGVANMSPNKPALIFEQRGEVVRFVQIDTGVPSEEAPRELHVFLLQRISKKSQLAQMLLRVFDDGSAEIEDSDPALYPIAMTFLLKKRETVALRAGDELDWVSRDFVKGPQYNEFLVLYEL